MENQASSGRSSKHLAILWLAVLATKATALPNTLNTMTLSTPSAALLPRATSSGDTDDGGSGASSYYFVFIAVALCATALGIFCTLKRKRKMRLIMHTGRRHDALRDDMTWHTRGDDPLLVRNWGQPVVYYRPARSPRVRGAETRQNEGLNEHGEAPPPYVPKTRSEEGEEVSGGIHTNSPEPAFPFQTLGREDIGLKPPDYMESNAYELGAHGPSAANASTSRRNEATIDGEVDSPAYGSR